jgi:outer membrane protein assembly factor BamB
MACSEGTLVAVEGDRVTALRSADLTLRWSARAGSSIRSSPVVARGMVFLGTARGLVALRLEDGSEAWTVAAAYGVGAAPLVLGNTLYACLGDEAVVALDPSTGARRWEHRCGAGRSAPVLAGGRVVLGLRTAEVLALDAATGRPAWRLPVDGAVSFAPAAVGSSVVVGDGGRRLRCVDAESGRVLWTRSVKGRFLGDGPAVSPRAIVFALDSLEVEAYDPATGRRLWNRWMGTFHLSSPAVAGDVVLFGARTRLVALDARTGDDAWQVELDAEVACPLVADGKVYAAAGRRIMVLR